MILLVAVSATAVAVVYARVQTPIYRSSIRLEVSARFDNGQQLALERQLPQLAQRVRTTDVAREVDQRQRLDLGAQAVLDKLRADAIVPSGQIQIEADDVDPGRVETIVLATAQVFEEQHAARNQGIPTGDRAIVSILDRPSPARLVWPQTRVIGGAALLLGLFVGALLALILDYLDDTLKTTADVEKALGTVILGRIPRSTGPVSASSGSEPAVGRVTEQAR